MQDQRLTKTHPLVLRKRGVETRLILGNFERANPDPALIRLVADARIWMLRLRHGEFPSIRSLARNLGFDHRHVTRALPLACLAPDIVAAIVEGRQPAQLTVSALKSIDTLPIRWVDQFRLLGIAAGWPALSIHLGEQPGATSRAVPALISATSRPPQSGVGSREMAN